MKYDSRIIHEVAERLYRAAAITEFLFTAVGLLVGGAVGWQLPRPSDHPLALLVAGAGAGAVFGYWIGHMRALKLRFDAQMALCQAQIEENTRGGKGAPGPQAGTIGARRSAGRIHDALNG